MGTMCVKIKFIQKLFSFLNIRILIILCHKDFFADDRAESNFCVLLRIVWQ